MKYLKLVLALAAYAVLAMFLLYMSFIEGPRQMASRVSHCNDSTWTEDFIKAELEATND